MIPYPTFPIKMMEELLFLESIVRPLLAVVEKEGKSFVVAEISGIGLAESPCYYKGREG